MIEKNVDCPLTNQILGHSSLSTTLIYAKASAEMQHRALEKAGIEDLFVTKENKNKESEAETFFASIGL